MAVAKARPEEFVRRFEELKRQYFQSQKKQYDSDGDEILSSAPDRAMIAKMFENMGLEIPFSPTEQPISLGERD